MKIRGSFMIIHVEKNYLCLFVFIYAHSCRKKINDNLWVIHDNSC